MAPIFSGPALGMRPYITVSLVPSISTPARSAASAVSIEPCSTGGGNAIMLPAVEPRVGKGEMVHPRRDIMVTTPVRAEREAREGAQGGHVMDVSLHSAAAIMRYRPIDVAASVKAVLIIAVEDDPVTSTDHPIRLYDAAGQPKKLIIQRQTTHYVAYDQYAGIAYGFAGPSRCVRWSRLPLRP